MRGRSGRQGDPGRSKFFVSLDDQLMRLSWNNLIPLGLINLAITAVVIVALGKAATGK